MLFPACLNDIYEQNFRVIDRQELPADKNNTYVIFLSGLNSHCDGSLYNQMGFTYLRHRFGGVGLAYRDERFLMYSYKGGRIQKGRWHPNPYTPADTGQPIQFSVRYLKDMIDEFSQYHPESRFLLVGYSLGGRIAFDYVTKYHLREPGPIKGIVTLNSPLTGSTYYNTEILSTIRPIWGSIAVKQLAAEYQLRNQMGVDGQKKKNARIVVEKGIHLATFGTKQDVIVKPFTACLADKYGHPVIEGDIISVNFLSGRFRELFGHSQILKQDYIANYIISVYIGTDKDDDSPNASLDCDKFVTILRPIC